MTTDGVVNRAIEAIEKQRLTAKHHIDGKLGDDFISLIDQAKAFFIDVKNTSRSLAETESKVREIESKLRRCFDNAQAMDDIRTGKVQPLRSIYTLDK